MIKPLFSLSCDSGYASLGAMKAEPSMSAAIIHVQSYSLVVSSVLYFGLLMNFERICFIIRRQYRVCTLWPPLFAFGLRHLPFHCGALSVCLRHCLWAGCPCIMPAGQRVVESVNTERKEKIGTLTFIKCSFGICDLLSVDKSKEEFMMI